MCVLARRSVGQLGSPRPVRLHGRRRRRRRCRPERHRDGEVIVLRGARRGHHRHRVHVHLRRRRQSRENGRDHRRRTSGGARGGGVRVGRTSGSGSGAAHAGIEVRVAAAAAAAVDGGSGRVEVVQVGREGERVVGEGARLGQRGVPSVRALLRGCALPVRPTAAVLRRLVVAPRRRRVPRLGGRIALRGVALEVAEQAHAQRVLDVHSLDGRQVARHLARALPEADAAVVESEAGRVETVAAETG